MLQATQRARPADDLHTLAQATLEKCWEFKKRIISFGDISDSGQKTCRKNAP